MSKPQIIPQFKFSGRKINRDLRQYTGEIIDFALSFAFANSSVFSSCVPFGLAYYAAYFKSSSWIAKFLGVLLGTLLSTGPIMSLKYIFPLMIYTFSGAFIKLEKTYIKAGIMGMLLLASSTVFCFLDGFLLYDAVLGISESFLCFAGVFVMKNGIPALKKGTERSIISPEELISITAVYAILILSLSKIPPIYGIKISNVLSIALILVMCLKGELGMGAAIGVVVGVINGISNYNLTSVIGAYAFSALCAGFFKPYGKVGVSLGFILANSLAAIFLNSSTEILISVYDIMAASVLFFVMPDIVIDYFTSFSQNARTAVFGKGDETKEIIRKRMISASDSLKELSKMFVCIEGVRYSKSDIIKMFNSASEKVCAKCPTRYVCWQSDYIGTYNEMLEMLKISDDKGVITPKNMPVSFKNKCTNPEEFSLAFNNMTESLKIDKIWRSKLVESRRNAANQLSSIGDVIKNISDDVCAKVDTCLEDIIKAELDKLGVKYNYVWMIVKNADEEKFEITVSLKSYSDSLDKSVKEAVSNAVGKDVRVGKVFKTNGEIVLKILPKEKFSIDVGVSQACKDGEEKCGDSYLSICLDGGGHVLAISDGMGTGENAHKESMSAIKLLEGFFEAGFETQTSLNLINSALLLKSENEGFSTMDLCSVDLCDGKVRFIKICGAASYIKTENKTERIMFSSLPMGIMERVDSPSCVRKIKGESMIIMMSDGVYESAEEGWVEKALCDIHTANPKVMSDTLLKKAIENCNGERKDDMTVIAARVWN